MQEPAARLSLLTENPYTEFIHDAETIAAIHAGALEMLADPRPHLRAAAARVLYAYGNHTREDVLAGLARLAEETDSDVWDDLLGELSVAAKGYGLTVEEAQPLIDNLRQQIRADESRDRRWDVAEALLVRCHRCIQLLQISCQPCLFAMVA